VPYIVDIDDSYGQARPSLRLVPDRDRLEALKVSDREVYDSIAAALGGQVVGYAHRGDGRDPLEISVRLPQSARSWGEGLSSLPVAMSQGAGGRLVSLGEVDHGLAANPARPTSSAATAATSTWSWANWPGPMRRRSTA
jgi:Cu/Ag efflux pump CusA